MRSRREFLQQAGMGTAGLVAGAALGRLSAGPEAIPPAAERRLRERDGSAADAVAPTRLGTTHVVWSLPVAAPVVALSFDDGPTPEYTPRVLAALDAVGATATFHAMGRNAVRHAALLREVLAAGHEIGNHSWTHRDLTGLTPEQTREQIVRGAREIEDVLGRPVTSFRPPRGRITGYALRVCAELDVSVHMWSCTRGSGRWVSPRHVAEHLGRTAVAGDVVGLHDGIGRGTFSPDAAFARQLAARREVEVQGLPQALHLLRERGLRLLSVARALVADPVPVAG